MEKLFALYNIKTVGFIDSANVLRSFAYTSKMQANDIFIEYFTIDTLPEEMVEELDDESEEPELGSELSVIMKHKNKYYIFLMYHDTMEIGVPVMLLQTIIFLVKLIEDTMPALLVDYLTSLSTDPLIPHEIKDKEHRDAANNLIKVKLQTVHRLIQEDSATLN